MPMQMSANEGSFPPLPGRRARRPLRLAAVTAVLLMAAGGSAPLVAQERPIPVGHELFVGSELEQYLRLLQTLGEVAPHQWSVRTFGPAEVARLRPTGRRHPWGDRYDFGAVEGVRLVRPDVAVVGNSSVPYGYNDGAVWAGRGVTVAGRVGVAGRFGPLSATIAPEFFHAQNADFDLHPASRPGDQRFAYPGYSNSIDLPQRFGTGGYGRLTPGQSTVRLDLGGVTAGVSTANQHWGPVWDQPLLLGNNAEGFPHAFLGTSRPVDLWIGRVHGRAVWGELRPSAYVAGVERRRRWMTGLVATFSPRGLPGLEVGGGRFFHQVWPSGGVGLDDLLWPFQSLLKEGLAGDGTDGTDPDNQLASVFGRWMIPSAGVEVYGEYAREDHNWNLRDLALEPDHNSGFVVGMARAWRPSADRVLSLRAEVLDTRVTHLARVRSQTPLYRHSRMREGHTHRGQILGAAAGFGGAHARLALDLYHPRGRWGGALVRSRRLVPPPPGEVVREGGGEEDVVYSAEVGGRLFLGRFELAGVLAPGYEFNRDLGDDRVNVYGRLEGRVGVGR